MKVCSKCGIEKELSEYHKRKTAKDGLKSQCKECRNMQNREYNKDNKEKKTAYGKWYRENCSEKVKATQRKYKGNNKRKILDYNNIYKMRRYKSDPVYKFGLNMKCCLRSSLKLNMNSKYLSCSIGFLKWYLELLFKPGMTWENYGKNWCVDHRVPLSFAKTEDELLRLNHYTNLQPLWNCENREKSNKIA